MIKKILLWTTFGGLVVLLVAGAVNRTLARSEAGGVDQNGDPISNGVPVGAQRGAWSGSEESHGRRTQGAPGGYGEGLPALFPADLTPGEIEGLMYMREEEKLARDVYLSLSELWGLPVFAHVGASEGAHMEAVAQVLTRYGLEDGPAQSQPGAFSDPHLASLYTGLMERGRRSLADALLVGGAIEEMDILDLQARLAQTGRVDIQRLYENLLRGSQNHLRAFAHAYSVESGESYRPQMLDDATYQAVLDSSGPDGGGGKGYGQGDPAGRADCPAE